MSEEEHHDLTQKFSDLSKKYKDASQKVKYLERKNATVMQKNKDMKESVRAWQEYADRRSGKQKPKSEAKAGEVRPQPLAAHALPDDRPHIPSSPGSAATVRTLRSLPDLGRSSPAPVVPFPHAGGESTSWTASQQYPDRGGEDQISSATLTPKPRLHADAPRHYVGAHVQGVSSNAQQEILDHENHQSANPSSSQTTVDEHVEPASRHEPALDAEEDEDIPEFVSERSLKRKRGEPSKSRFEIYADRSSDGTPVRPHRVKEEPCSSPPISAYKIPYNETMDLDDPAPNLLKTPRHNRRRLSIQTESSDTPRQERSNGAPLTQDVKNEAQENDAYLELDSFTELTTEVREQEVAASIEARAFSAPAEATQAERTVLRAIDSNIVNSASEEPPNKRSRRFAAENREKHEFLAESDETPPPLDDELRRPPHSARARINQRLRDIKNPQTPSKFSPKTPKSEPVKIKTEQIPTPPSTLSRTARTSSTGSRATRSASNVRSHPRDDPTPDRPVWTMKAPETRSSDRKSGASPMKERGRLREKPVIELGVQDFKPNPEYNQGYSYAFSETVRKRGDRMCLPGCTNLQCCGSTFRVFAEAQGPLSSSQEEALLEDYLGDAYNNKQMTRMSSGERQELVLQARTKKMAKESGKHREAYERRRTPPGFWRVDFPTTQEQQEDRARAKEQEKEIVQERWLEAHRKGGKWIFRDE
ncbi:SAE2-domain-containing protein [Stemphylium lycopersici]|uniref:SAE2-domain-containing protein n=1 Tax=Stemphylium lycopersici TaxID=183478 RepID=A0A364N4H6_STELY|nr:hypothetical protein TW65_01579 [Stemphylium lycopersici]RAR02426.1 SAE2-domain-containing protein [Stemphylium lycopersici]RAR11497.1 SAE2-domain-containing protein [Stemphylium lycopersici]